LLILETFGYLEELHQAMLAAQDVNPELPIVVQVTIDEDGNLPGRIQSRTLRSAGSLGCGRHRLQL
jgi:methionine synthase I (cobalamin-dependent)